MTKKTIDAVVAGHVCFDVIPPFGENRQTGSGEVFVPGKLINVGPAVLSTGGPVSNTGLAMQRLGIKTRLMGKVGDDFFGRATLNKLKESGAEKGMVVVKGENSAYTIVIAPPGIDRIFLHNSGANNTFGFKDVNFDLVRQAKLFHLGYPPLMKRLYSDGGKELTRIFKAVAGIGTTTSLDMSLPDATSSSGQVDWRSILKATAPYIDIFLPSAEEVMFMLDKESFLDKRKTAGRNDIIDYFEAEELSRLAGKLLDYGVGIVGIKCGHRGLYLRTAGRKRLAAFGSARPADLDNWTGREIWEPSYHVDKFASATGSGDSCIAGFLAALIKGETVESTVRYACALGAQNVRVFDAISGIKNWAETTAEMKSGWKKNKLVINDPGWRFDKTGQRWTGPGDTGKTA